ITTDTLGSLFSVLLLRLWLGIRSLQAGIEKFSGINVASNPVIIDGKPNTDDLMTHTSEKVYALTNYQGVPAGLYKSLASEPLITGSMLKAYNYILGPILLLLGLSILLGLASRISLLTMGIVYTSLTFGLILLNQSAGIAWLATHVLLVSLMLIFAHHNRYELGNLIAVHTPLKFLKNK
ncbi:MAG: hypothetical protein AAF571_03905, partial [Verrucomicrobiota bacterium]